MTKLAIFTITRNEPVFLPLWVKHYLPMVEHPSHLFILDNDSTDDTVTKLIAEYGITVINAHNEKWFDHVWLRDTVCDFQKKLLDHYKFDVVLFAETDEFVMIDPIFNGEIDLFDLIDTNPNPIISTTGWDVVHNREVEKNVVDFTKPILIEQRKFYARGNHMSKPLLCRVPVLYHVGFHSLREKEGIPDPRLLLIHMHYCDFDYCKERTSMRRQQNWNEGDVISRAGFQNRASDAEIEQLFREIPFTDCNLIEIPQHFKGRL